MNILFIYPTPHSRYFHHFQYHHGIGLLSAILKSKGHKTDLIQTFRLDSSQLKKKIKEFKPDLIAITTTTDSFELAKKYIAAIAHYKIPVVLGGCHPTIAPEECISVKGILGICVGEGEYALPELLDALKNKKNKEELYKIKNFWFNTKNGIIKNPLRDLVQDLDAFPFPDRDIFNYHALLKQPGYVPEFIASRGCPYQCTFCINPTLMKLYAGKGKYVRYKSVDYLIREIKDFLEKYPETTYINFNDDLFTADWNWIEKFCKRYKEEIKIPFRCCVRIKVIDLKLARLLKNSGCVECAIGIESGNEFIRNHVLKKALSTEEIIKGVKMLKRAKLRVLAFNMIGMPFETKKAIMDTVRLNRLLKCESIQCSMFRPYPGTEAYEMCKRYGWLSSRKVESFLEPITLLDQYTIKMEDVGYHYKMFHWRIHHPVIAVLISPFMMIRWGKYKEKFLYDYTILPVIQAVRDLPVFKGYVNKEEE